MFQVDNAEFSEISEISTTLYLSTNVCLLKVIGLNDSKETEECCSSEDKAVSCCEIEGIVQIDSRGQIVLPRDLRKDAGLTEGTKLVVVRLQSKGEIAGICLYKTDKFNIVVKDTLNPVMKEIFAE